MQKKNKEESERKEERSNQWIEETTARGRSPKIMYIFCLI